MMDSLLFAVALPLIFIIHNIEECMNFNDSVPTFFKIIGGHFYNRMIFTYAVTILSLVVVTASILNYLIVGQLVHVFAVIVVFSMLINGLQHVLGSIWQRKMVPGTWSSIFLIIPFCSLTFYSERFDVLQSIHHTLTYLLVSVVVMIVSIFLSFLIAFGIDWMIKRMSS